MRVEKNDSVGQNGLSYGADATRYTDRISNFLVASLFKWNFSYSCAAVENTSTNMT